MRINKNFPRTDFFSIFSKMERIRKGSDMPEKKWGSPSIQQKYSHTKLTQSHQLYILLDFRLGACAWKWRVNRFWIKECDCGWKGREGTDWGWSSLFSRFFFAPYSTIAPVYIRAGVGLARSWSPHQTSSVCVFNKRVKNELHIYGCKLEFNSEKLGMAGYNRF